ncbi:hypothetical protein H0G86_011341 [Trichoderma simmonsii]|uniref:Uncharacterized protein n=1 Tax=Trichoderma simmonsii TaxID=1491479 RepID=A0A8G0LQJ1_9HYPO|nr:hypothetical protein H0G86_011341 [Trichoderma simmonsii]
MGKRKHIEMEMSDSAKMASIALREYGNINPCRLIIDNRGCPLHWLLVVEADWPRRSLCFANYSTLPAEDDQGFKLSAMRSAPELKKQVYLATPNGCHKANPG